MSEFVYKYGTGDDVYWVDEDDVISLDSDTASHVIGWTQYRDTRNLFVFDDYSSLNVYGRVGQLVVDGETWVTNEKTTETTEITDDIVTSGFSYELGDGDRTIFIDAGDVISIGSDTASHIVGIKQYDSHDRTLFVFDDYRSLNVYGIPSEVIIGGETIITNTVVADTTTDDVDDNRFVYTYDSGNAIFEADEDSYIDLSGVTWDQIRGLKIDEASSLYVFDNFNTLNVWGPAKEVAIENSLYEINYSDRILVPTSIEE